MEICEGVPPAYGSLTNNRTRTSTFDDRHNIHGYEAPSRHHSNSQVLPYLLLLSNPCTQLFQSMLQIIAAATCFGRAEEFLETAPRIDNRKVREAYCFQEHGYS